MNIWLNLLVLGTGNKGHDIVLGKIRGMTAIG